MSSSLTGLPIVFASMWKHAVVKLAQINPTTVNLETNFGRAVAESKFCLLRWFRRQRVTWSSNYSFKFEMWMCLHFNKLNWPHSSFVCILKKEFPIKQVLLCCFPSVLLLAEGDEHVGNHFFPSPQPSAVTRKSAASLWKEDLLLSQSKGFLSLALMERINMLEVIFPHQLFIPFTICRQHRLWKL